MKVAVISNFRNSSRSGQVTRFTQQLAALRDLLQTQGHRMRFIAVYGDCVDDTEDALMNAALKHNFAMTLVERNHGGPVFGSTEDKERLKALSYVGNGGLEAVLDQDEVVFYVESDLIWNPQTVLNLMNRLGPNVDVIAPMVYAGVDNEGRRVFYDIFVFRKNGSRFSPFYPYHPDINLDGVTHVDSVGSALVMRAEVARHCRMLHDNVLLAFCQDVWDHQWTVNVDATQAVFHP